MGVGIVICSRSDSKRIPAKPFVQINGTPVLEHLVRRLLPTGFHVYLAVPHFDYDLYKNFAQRFSKKDVTVVCGSATDPLARMASVAENQKLDTVVRVCHDKIFIDPIDVKIAVENFQNANLDYMYASTFVDGSGFEVISESALIRSSVKFKDIEHVGYAIHCVTTPDKVSNMSSISRHRSNHRLLIDYPEDLKVMELVLSTLGNSCTLVEALEFLDKNPFISQINRLPMLTVYTCGFNAQTWIGECMGSVASQDGFKNYEYLLIDDFSSDKTAFLMSKFCSIYQNSKWIRNKENLGLASSSNVALSHARGKYILRLDADDYLSGGFSLKLLINHIEKSGEDIVYPDNYFGSYKTIQSGSEHHHVGGAIFRTRAANHVKFTDGLRGYEGFDFFERAKDKLRIGYYQHPTLFYRQHSGSLSAGPKEERLKIKEQINESLKSGNGNYLSEMQQSHG